MKATAKAPANIAFIKYWGKRDEKLRIPMNNSISMNLSGVSTTTTVQFSQNLKNDLVKIDNQVNKGRERERVVKHLDRVRMMANINLRAKVNSRNNFAQGTGMASSASGFAALTLAATRAVGLTLSERQLSILARLGSGSACRSIPDGFVEWKAGESNETSYAYSLLTPEHWDICDVIAVVGKKAKKVSSTRGHTRAESSPFYQARISGMTAKVREIKKALKHRDFTKFGEIVEAEAINMHAVMMTSKPALYYWLPKSLEIMLAVQEWRNLGLGVYFTLDAGPNVHLLCQKKDSKKLLSRLKRIERLDEVIPNKPSVGAQLL